VWLQIKKVLPTNRTVPAQFRNLKAGSRPDSLLNSSGALRRISELSGNVILAVA
jgi:hypothetical protein